MSPQSPFAELCVASPAVTVNSFHSRFKMLEFAATGPCDRSTVATRLTLWATSESLARRVAAGQRERLAAKALPFQSSMNIASALHALVSRALEDEYCALFARQPRLC